MLLCFLTLWLNLYSRVKQNCSEALVKAVAYWTLYLFVITEVLSVFHKLNYVYLLIMWYMADIVLIALLIYKLWKKKATFSSEKMFLKTEIKLYYFFLLVPVIYSFYLAIKTIPYNWDSMTYHLSRVAHWAQNQSVAHYSTNIVRQVASPVLTEFVVANVYILCRNNDIFVNLIQCFSFIISSYIIFQVAKKIGCKSFYCFLASFIFLTTPIAFAESVTTQVDNFANIWMLIFVYYLLDFLNIDEKLCFNKENIEKVIILALCVAFGYLAKPSVLISMVIFACWLLAVCIKRRDSVKVIFKFILLALPVMLFPMAIEIARNIKTFGSISSPLTGQRQLIGTLKPAYVFVNWLKNLTFNMPNIYDSSSQARIYSFVTQIAEKLNVVINDPSISEDGSVFAVRPAQFFSIDSAVNPVIVFLSILCVVWLVATIRSKGKDRKARGFAIASVISFNIFCAVLLWELYVSRYMISYMALMAIAVSSQLQKFGENEKFKPINYAIIGITIFCSLVDWNGLIKYDKQIVNMYSESPRTEGYWFSRLGASQASKEDYEIALDYITSNGYKKIGLYCSEDHYEYPLIKMLEGKIERMEHVGVSNETMQYADTDFIPDCIFVVGQIIGENYWVNGVEYQIGYNYDKGLQYILIRK